MTEEESRLVVAFFASIAAVGVFIGLLFPLFDIDDHPIFKPILCSVDGLVILISFGFSIRYGRQLWKHFDPLTKIKSRFQGIRKNLAEWYGKNELKIYKWTTGILSCALLLVVLYLFYGIPENKVENQPNHSTIVNSSTVDHKSSSEASVQEQKDTILVNNPPTNVVDGLVMENKPNDYKTELLPKKYKYLLLGLIQKQGDKEVWIESEFPEYYPKNKSFQVPIGKVLKSPNKHILFTSPNVKGDDLKSIPKNTPMYIIRYTRVPDPLNEWTQIWATIERN